ncbi:Rid family hydrolase [Halopenitus persicus]|uniref:Rid family hydrolase n=1 Tax=Halopenitus persicus TaxID=1048396 RepID=UPI000BBB4831|nr:RidA family protein [Halopenitus persicus]
MSFTTHHTGTNWEENAGFSQVITVPADHSLIVTAGQVAFDDDAQVVGEGNVEAQTRKSFDNLERTLNAADATMNDVIKLRYSITDRSHYDTVKAVRDEYLSEPHPTGMLAVLDELAMPELLVEIEALAAVPE